MPVDNLGETPIEGGGSSTNSTINLDIEVSVRRQDTVLERVPLGQAFRRFSEEFQKLPPTMPNSWGRARDNELIISQIFYKFITNAGQRHLCRRQNFYYSHDLLKVSWGKARANE